MHQHQYINKIEALSLKNTSPSRPLNRVETRNLKALVGQIQWVAKQTRPDLSFATCELSTRITCATTKDMRNANKHLLKLQQDLNSKVIVPKIGDISQSSLVVYSDASHANLHDHGSQRGFIISLYGVNQKSSPLTWKSHKLKRVVKECNGS